MTPLQKYPCVLAIYLNTRGFAFVVFESSLSPIDWGLKQARVGRKNRWCLAKTELLFDRYRPSVLIVEDTFSEVTRRNRRIRSLNEKTVEHASVREIPTCAYSRDDVLKAFNQFSIHNKRDLALVIAQHIPVFERYVPPPRKPWMSEDARMGLFDAAALALTFFQSNAGDEQEAG